MAQTISIYYANNLHVMPNVEFFIIIITDYEHIKLYISFRNNELHGILHVLCVIFSLFFT